MKIHAYLLLTIMPFLGLYSGKSPQKLVYKNTKVILNMDDYICSEDQWVYVYGYKSWISGNEETFFDSAFIAKGQHQVELNFKIPCATDAELFFSRNGPSGLGFAVEQDSCLVLNVDESSPFYNTYCCTEATQGSLNNFLYKLVQERDDYCDKLKYYTKEEQTDSINILSNNYLNRLKSVMNEASEAVVLEHCFSFMKYYVPNVNNLNEILQKFATKFDWCNSLKEYYDISITLPPSEEAKKVEKRYAQLSQEKLRCELLSKNLGDRMDLTFEDADGKKISTNNINTPYVFVDFWASWCKPCRKEIPYVKETVAKYKDAVTVYAVSIDNKREAWQKAIEEDSTQEFLQMIGTLRNGTPTRLLKQLDIKTIPANFLLDKERRIVAKNLRGEQFIQTLDSLMKQ